MSNKIAPLPLPVPLPPPMAGTSVMSRSQSLGSGDGDDDTITRTPSTIGPGSDTPSPQAKTVKLAAPKASFKRTTTVANKRQFTAMSGNKNQRHASAILNGQEITERALFCMFPNHPLRRTCIYMANSRWYTNFNLGLILLNCVVLMVESGRDLSSSGYSFDNVNAALNIIDVCFTFFFTLEMVVKVIAGGFYFSGQSSYIRSWWNRLDFIVVCFALANFLPGMANFTYVRALRLFRPLKAANNLPGLRVMMNAMLAATMTLGNLSLFVFLLLFTFALFGLQIYRDAFRNRCISDTDQPPYDFATTYGFAGCSDTTFVWDFLGPHQCDVGFSCLDVGTNPYADTMGYDNILKSWVLSLIVMSGEGWSDIMFMADDSVSAVSWVMFITLACLSNYLAGELLVAVMSVKFEDAKEEEQSKMKDEEEQKQAVREAEKRIHEFKKNLKKEAKKKRQLERRASRRNLAAEAANAASEEMPAATAGAGGGLARLVGDMETAQVMQLADVIKRQNRKKAADKAASERSLQLSRRTFGDRPSTAGSDSSMRTRDGTFQKTPSLLQTNYNLSSFNTRNQTFMSSSQQSQLKNARTFVSTAGSAAPRRGSIQALGSSTQSSSQTSQPSSATPPSNLPQNSSASSLHQPKTPHASTISASSTMSLSNLCSTPHEQLALSPNASSPQLRAHHRVNNPSLVISDSSADSDSMATDDSFSRSDTMSSLDSSYTLTSNTTLNKKNTMVLRLQTTFQAASQKWDSVADDMRMPIPILLHQGIWHERWYDIRLVCHRLIFSPGAFWVFSAFTVLNCAVLACDFWGIAPEMKSILDNANLCFFILFSIELAMRLIAIDWEYFRHGYLVLDFITVLVAILDTAFSGSIPTLNSLRAFRVFRMFTVFRHWKSMQRIMRQARSSIEDLFYFGLVLFLFVFIFAQLGVQIALNREDFPNPEGPARDNWDSIGWAMIQVFQISTPENWNQVLYDMVQGVGWGGGVFIIVTLVVMHYIIESLFVVVMFSHFGTDEEGEQQEAEIEEMRRNAAVAPLSAGVDNVQQLINRVQAHDSKDSSLTFDTSTKSSHLALTSARTPMTRNSTFGATFVNGNFIEPLSPLTTNLTVRALTFGGSVNAGALTRRGSLLPTFAGLRDEGDAAVDGEVAQEGAESPTNRFLTRMHTMQQLSPGRGSHKQRVSLFDTAGTRRSSHQLPPINAASATTGSHAFISISPRSRSPLQPDGSEAFPFPSSSSTSASMASSLSTRTKGFLGRIARNIEKSKMKKELEERDKQVEKLRASRSNSKRSSKIGASPLHSPEASQVRRRASVSIANAQELHEALTSRLDREREEKTSARGRTAAGLNEEKITARRRHSVTYLEEFKEVDAPLASNGKFVLPAEAKHNSPRLSPRAADATLSFLHPTLSSSSSSLAEEDEKKQSALISGSKRSDAGAAEVEEEKHVTLVEAVSAQDAAYARSSVAAAPSSVPSSTLLSLSSSSPPSTNSAPSLLPAHTLTHHGSSDILTLGAPQAVDLISAVPLVKTSNLPPLRDARVSSIVPSSLSPAVQESKDALSPPPFRLKTLSTHTSSPASTSVSSPSEPPRTLVAASEVAKFNHKRQASTFEPIKFASLQDEPLALPALASSTDSSALSSASGAAGTPQSTQEDTSVKPPEYNLHVQKNRRRFVIAHHSPPSQPWYRQDMPEPFTERSLFFFEPSSRVRVFLTRLMHSDAWSIGVVGLIFFSCMLLAMDYPDLDSNSSEARFIAVADIVTTSLYVLEMLLRFVVFGAVMGPRASLKNGWNVMEFIIVIVSVASLISPGVSALKALRALRPLRVLSRIPGAKVVVSSLGKSILNIGNVLVVSFLLLFCLSLVAVELFKGRLQQCLSVPDGNPLAFDQVDCDSNGGLWTNPLWTGNYDNVASALLVLFELCTEENWPGTMYSAVDATEPGLQPVVNSNQWNGIFFVVAIIIGSLFIKTLFTATILDGYSLNYAEITGAGGGTTPLQQKWLDFYKLAIDYPPPLSKPRPNTKWFHKTDLRMRRFFFDLAKSLTFEYFFLGVISINVIALSLSFSNQPLWYANMLNVVNSICTWLFVAEIVILWLGSGVKSYFNSRSNQFDFLVVILTAYEFFYEQNLVSFHIGFNPSIFRVIRMVRIFKLFSKFPKLVQLGQTVWFSLPALYNVTFLMLLEYFIYSVLGVALFGKVKLGFYMTEHRNYRTFTAAMVTLFTEMTGENWNGIMRDCMVQPPFCDPDAGECGNTSISPLFHVSFQVLSSMLVMDLIVAIILNQFENQLQKEKRSGDALISERDMKVFGEHWAHFARGKLTMPVSKLPAFLRYLPQPFGFKKGEGQLFGIGMAHFLDELNIPSDGQMVHYLDVVHQLAYHVFAKRYPEIKKMEEQEEETIRELLSDDDEDDDPDAPAGGEGSRRKLESQHSMEMLEAEKLKQRTSTIASRLLTRVGTMILMDVSDEDAKARVQLPYTAAGIRLVNEDLQLITRQAQNQFPSLATSNHWHSYAGVVHRVVICQKLLRGVFDRRRLRDRFVQPLLDQMQAEDEATELLLEQKEQSNLHPSSSASSLTGLEAASSPETNAATTTLTLITTTATEISSTASTLVPADANTEEDESKDVVSQTRLSRPNASESPMNRVQIRRASLTTNAISTPSPVLLTPSARGGKHRIVLSMSQNSPSSSDNRKHSVVAEMMAMRNMAKQQSEGRIKSLSSRTVSMDIDTSALNALALNASSTPPQSTTSPSPIHSLSATVPPLKKTPSLPLESTLESHEEGSLHADDSGESTPLPLLRLGSTSLRSNYSKSVYANNEMPVPFIRTTSSSAVSQSAVSDTGSEKNNTPINLLRISSSSLNTLVPAPTSSSPRP